MPQMKVQNVRFGPHQWGCIALAAEDEGISMSQFIRDAAYARAIAQLVEMDTGRLGLPLALARALSNHPELLSQLERALAEAAAASSRHT